MKRKYIITESQLKRLISENGDLSGSTTNNATADWSKFPCVKDFETVVGINGKEAKLGSGEINNSIYFYPDGTAHVSGLEKKIFNYSCDGNEVSWIDSKEGFFDTWLV